MRRTKCAENGKGSDGVRVEEGGGGEVICEGVTFLYRLSKVMLILVNLLYTSSCGKNFRFNKHSLPRGIGKLVRKNLQIIFHLFHPIAMSSSAHLTLILKKIINGKI